MPSTTVSTVILTAVILAIVLTIVPLARNFAAAQNQPAVYLELRGITFMVEEQMVSAASAAAQANGGMRVQVDVPRTLYGGTYTISVVNDFLQAAAGNIEFSSPLPSMTGVAWRNSIFKSGGTRLFVVANMTLGAIDIGVSD